MKRTSLLVGMALLTVLVFNSCGGPKGIKWTTFETISYKKSPEKLVFVELYTDWCAYCRRMENLTFRDPVIAGYMNKRFHSIRFNAEDRKTIIFNDKEYRFDPSDTKRGRHQLAKAMMSESDQQGYPTVVFLDENLNLIQAVPGYITARDFEVIAHYFGDGAYKRQSWAAFKEQYKIGNAGYSDLN